jgi:hypothetical protein
LDGKKLDAGGHHLFHFQAKICMDFLNFEIKVCLIGRICGLNCDQIVIVDTVSFEGNPSVRETRTLVGRYRWKPTGENTWRPPLGERPEWRRPAMTGG